MQRAVLGKWMRVSKRHPMAERMMSAMVAPNPLYASAMKQSGVPPEGVEEFDNLYIERDDYILFPRAYAERYFPTYDDTRHDRPVKFPKFQLEYRKGQEKFVDGVIEYLSTRSGCIAQAATGFGKTVCGNAIIFQLQQRTLILVHTGFLMDQWEERLEEAGLPKRNIGKVRRDRWEYGGRYKVTIAMIQTLLARHKEIPKDFYDAFGLVLSDEVHNMGASTFRKTITMFNPRYRLGLSATPERKDGCELVFESHIGPVAIIGRGKALVPRIIERYVDHPFDETPQALQMRKRSNHGGRWRWKWEDSMPRIETYLVNHQVRNERIVKMMVASIMKDRKMLVLTSRRDHVTKLKKLAEKALAQKGKRIQVGVLVGGMKDKDWAISIGCPLKIGTYNMVKEALDVPELDAMLFATPRSDIVQAVGRILREREGKKQPRVIDLIDMGIQLCEGMAKVRFRQYHGFGWVELEEPSRMSDGVAPRRLTLKTRKSR